MNLSALGNNLTTQAGTSLQGHIDTSGLPALSGAPTGTGNIQSGLNFSNAPGITDTNQAIQQAQDAVYGQAASRLDPQWTNNQNDLNAQLANQGVVQGSEAYNRAQDDFSRQKNDAYNQANYSAIQTGDALQNQLYNQQLGTRQEAVGEDTAAGNFANSAQAQQYGQGLSGAALNDQARSQGLTEQANLQELPLNELNALRSQSQVQQPTFSSVPQSSVAPTNVSGNVYSSYNDQVASANNFMNGLFGAGSALASGIGNAGGISAFFSDRRLKRNLRRIGVTPRDKLPLYEFSYRGLTGRFIGVIAQHVAKIRPEAVLTHQSGYLMVDYARIG